MRTSLDDRLAMRLSGCAMFVAAAAVGCVESKVDNPELSRDRRQPTLEIGEARPATSERTACGPIASRITRDSPRFSELTEADSQNIVFKNEEGTGADRWMHPELRSRLYRLEELVTREWPELHLRVTEAWDEDGEHSGESLHYEGRAADLTTSDRDRVKLGRLAALTVEAGFGWVYRERTHVHASVPSVRGRRHR